MSWQMIAVFVAGAVLGGCGLTSALMERTPGVRKLAGAFFVAGAIVFGACTAFLLVFLPFAFMGYIFERLLVLLAICASALAAYVFGAFRMFRSGRKDA